MLSFRNRLILAALTAPLLCAFLYWIDCDPAYPIVWDTVKEFTFLTIIFCFPLSLGVTWFFRKRLKA